jgi:hypothetical protein
LGKIQNLVNASLEENQASIHQFIARAGEFVLMPNIEDFRQAFVGIETHAILIGNGNENEIEQLFQSGEALVESIAQESMINPTE